MASLPTTTPTWQEGSAGFLLTLSPPWPRASSSLLASFQVVDGELTIVLLESGRLLVRIAHAETAMEVASSIIQLSGPTAETCLLSWKYPDVIVVYLGERLIASLAEPERVPTILIVPPLSAVRTKQTDFTQRNKAAALARKRKTGWIAQKARQDTHRRQLCFWIAVAGNIATTRPSRSHQNGKLIPRTRGRRSTALASCGGRSTAVTPALRGGPR